MDETEMPNSPEKKTSKEVFFEYVSEIAGYEKGFVRTFADLRKHRGLLLTVIWLRKESTPVLSSC